MRIPYHGLLDIVFNQEELDSKKENIYSSITSVCLSDATNIKHVVDEKQLGRVYLFAL